MLRRFLSGCVLLAANCAAFATTASIDINDDAARLALIVPSPTSKIEFDFAWLHHQDNGEVLSAGVHLADIASGGPNPVQAGIGGKLYYIDPDVRNADGGALTIGGFVRYVFPQYNRVAVNGYLYVAPDVLGFGDVDQFRDIGLGVSYNVLRDADVYVGYRSVHADFTNTADLTFDTGLHVGLRLSF